MVSSTVAAGLTAVTYTGNTPDWALPPQVLAKYGPGIGYRFPPSQNHTDSFIAFFTAVATRYRGKLKMYEVSVKVVCVQVLAVHSLLS